MQLFNGKKQNSKVEIKKLIKELVWKKNLFYAISFNRNIFKIPWCLGQMLFHFLSCKSFFICERTHKTRMICKNVLWHGWLKGTLKLTAGRGTFKSDGDLMLDVQMILVHGESYELLRATFTEKCHNCLINISLYRQLNKSVCFSN